MERLTERTADGILVKEDHRENITQESSRYESYKFFSDEGDYDPCHRCPSFGSSGCRNECPYGD